MDSLRESVRAALGDTYIVEQELSGGMSCVFVAEDRALARRVVIKVLHPQLAASVSVERFRREILTVAGLQHPHIVGVLSTGNLDGLPYFVMPFVDGESLAERLVSGPLSVRETVAVLKDVARALAFAHERGVVHRDIKPGNILLAGGSAMVTDFGVAKALSSARRTAPDDQSGRPTHTGWGLTTAGTSLGTMLYMAPEQAAADPEIDGRADIYALGVTAYEMLTGAPPFAGLPARAMFAARMSSEAPAISSVRHDIPRALDALLTRCLASDPANRPQSAQELVEALEAPEVLSGEFATIPRVRRARIGTPAAIAAGVLALIGVGAATAAYSHSPRLRGAADSDARPSIPASAPALKTSEVAVVPFVDLGSSTADNDLAAGITNAVAGSLAKSRSLRVVSPSVASALMQQLRNGVSDAGVKRAGALLLEGTVQREGKRLRVTARLSNASDGVMRWADVYDREGRDVFKVTDDIAAAIVASVAHPTS